MEFQNWLEIDNLLTTYQSEAAIALQSQSFRAWETGEFKRIAIDHQQAIVKWVHQACEIFEKSRPNQLLVTFPGLPISGDSAQPTDKKGLSDDVPIAVVTGLGWAFGGPMGAAVLGSASYILNKALDRSSSRSEAQEIATACQEIAKEYLMHFSRLNLAAIADYEKVAQRVTAIDISKNQSTQTTQQYQLELLRSILERLRQTETLC